MQELTCWMSSNWQDGGLVVFITSDSDFLREVSTVVEADGFSAELLFYGPSMSRAPGMRERVDQYYEWLDWLRTEMQMPQLQMHPFAKIDLVSPANFSGMSVLMACTTPIVSYGNLSCHINNTVFGSHSTVAMLRHCSDDMLQHEHVLPSDCQAFLLCF